MPLCKRLLKILTVNEIGFVFTRIIPKNSNKMWRVLFSQIANMRFFQDNVTLMEHICDKARLEKKGKSRWRACILFARRATNRQSLASNRRSTNAVVVFQDGTFAIFFKTHFFSFDTNPIINFGLSHHSVNGVICWIPVETVYASIALPHASKPFHCMRQFLASPHSLNPAAL